MPQATTSYSDLQIPTVNDDGNTYGVIINQFFEDLTGKIYELAGQITSVQADLGDTNTANTILYNINQLTTINTILTTSTASGGDGVTSDKLRTGTTVQLHPDPYSGSHTPTSSWPAYTGTGEALESISVPTTESEILNFDYQAFKTALDPIVSVISARISQAQADIAAARSNICKAKAYIDTYNAGGTTVRDSEYVYFTVNGIGQFRNSAWYDFYSSTYSNGILTVAYTLNTSVTNGVVGGQTPAQAHQTFVTEGMLANGTATDIWVSEGQAVQQLSLNTVFIYNEANGDRVVQFSNSSGSTPVSVTWYPTSSTYQLLVTGPSVITSWNSNLNNFSLSKKRVIETQVYSAPDVSYCDTTPGGPHFISGSYS